VVPRPDPRHHYDGWMSGSVLEELAAPLRAAVAAAGGEDRPLQLDRPADPSLGDYASAVALTLAKPLASAPRSIAERIVEGLESPWIDAAEIAGPGFINLRLRPSWYGHVVGRVLAEGAGYGAGAAAHPQRLQVEFVSGNPTGPMTVATARNAAYGDSLARLFKFAGHSVEREYYFNDTGRQIELFGASLRARARGEEPPEDGYQGDYVTEIARSLGLPPDAPVEQWARAGTDAMMERIRNTLTRFRVVFDSWFLERSLHEDGTVQQAIERVRAAGHVYERDGAVWLASEALGDDKDRVLVRSNGEPTYFAGDLAYIVSKLDRGFDAAVYVLGADHHGYVGRLKAAARALGYDPDRVDVQIYQLINLKGGKMSKRAGRVVTLDDLLDAVGVDAARFVLVQRSHDQQIELDLDLLVQQNSENPVYYCQYAHARIAAILRNAGDAADRARPSPLWSPEPPEAELVKALAEFPDLVAEAADRRAPHRIAGHVQETAKTFHQFYKQCRVIGAEPEIESSRLALCQATKRVLATALDLLAVEAPERM
jgi:arginyl-tRNA synthetase